MSRDQGDPDYAGYAVGTSVRTHPSPRRSVLEERLAFLKYLQERGTSRAALRNVSGQMLHVIHLLKLETLRDVSVDEVKEAARSVGRTAASEREGPQLRSNPELLRVCSEEVAALRG